jgi:hypothetical protein
VSPEEKVEDLVSAIGAEWERAWRKGNHKVLEALLARIDRLTPREAVLLGVRLERSGYTAFGEPASEVFEARLVGPRFYQDDNDDLLCDLGGETFKLGDGADQVMTFETARELRSIYDTRVITDELLDQARAWYAAQPKVWKKPKRPVV